nr:hypothetical protein 1 [Ginkgo biloba tombusvirus]
MKTIVPLIVAVVFALYEVKLRAPVRVFWTHVLSAAVFLQGAFITWDDSWWGFGIIDKMRSWAFQRELRRSRWSTIRNAKRSARMVVRNLHTSDLLDLELPELTDKTCPVRVAYCLSRNVRRKMKNPKYSAANELVAWDVVEKVRPEGMRTGDWNRITPLVVKLAFVRDADEETANSVFKNLKEWVENEGPR